MDSNCWFFLRRPGGLSSFYNSPDRETSRTPPRPLHCLTWTLHHHPSLCVSTHTESHSWVGKHSKLGLTPGVSRGHALFSCQTIWRSDWLIAVLSCFQKAPLCCCNCPIMSAYTSTYLHTHLRSHAHITETHTLSQPNDLIGVNCIMTVVNWTCVRGHPGLSGEGGRGGGGKMSGRCEKEDQLSESVSVAAPSLCCPIWNHPWPNYRSGPAGMTYTFLHKNSFLVCRHKHKGSL